MFHKRFFCRRGKNISAIPHFAVWRIFMLYHSSIGFCFYNGNFQLCRLYYGYKVPRHRQFSVGGSLCQSAVDLICIFYYNNCICIRKKTQSGVNYDYYRFS